MTRGRSQPQQKRYDFSIHHLVFADTPQVNRMDVALAVAERDEAPAGRAFVDATDGAGFHIVADACSVVGFDPDRPLDARFDYPGPPVPWQGDQHPPPDSAGGLNQPPFLIF